VIWGWVGGALGVIQIIAHLTRPHRTATA
jgi:hypothetical protein